MGGLQGLGTRKRVRSIKTLDEVVWKDTFDEEATENMAICTV